jgi:hypothetical protein
MSKRNRVECVCKGCGKDFTVPPSTIRKGGGKYCSRDCTKKGENRECPVCSTSFYVTQSAIRKGEGTYCSRKCSNPFRGSKGEKNGNWKDGKHTRSDGYVMVRVSTDKYELEHRVVMADHIGRELLPNEQVHHINRQRNDNRIENLELTTISDHIKDHHAPKKDPSKWQIVSCLNCGGRFEKRASEMRKTKTHYCSNVCFRTGYKPASESICIGVKK